MSTLYGDFTTRAQIDAEYDVERSVPDFMVYARQYVDGSATARSMLDGRLGLRYGPTLDEYLDVFPASRPNAPILVFLHGGYWRILSARDFSFVASGPVAAGVTVAIVNYSLCPAVTLDEIVRQTRAAIVWLWRHAREHNGDPENIHVGGHSAGGQLTAMAALTEWERDYGLPRTAVKSGISVSGLFDLAPLRHSFLQDDLRLDDGLIARNSPQFLVRPVPVPLLVTCGGDESAEFLRQSEDFLDAWVRAGNRGVRFAQPGRNHFTAITGFADPDSALCREVFKLMRHTPARPTEARRPRLPSRRPHGEAGQPGARDARRPRIPARRTRIRTY